MRDALLIVLGGVLASGAGYFQSRVQRGWEVKDRAEDRSAEREREVRERADAQALRAIAAADALLSVLHSGRVLMSDARPGRDEPERRATFDENLAVLRSVAVFLTEPLRGRVERDADLVDNADELVVRGFAHIGGRWIASDAMKDARVACGAYLRGEPLPNPELEHAVLLTALSSLEEFWRFDEERQLAEAEEAMHQAPESPAD